MNDEPANRPKVRAAVAYETTDGRVWLKGTTLSLRRAVLLLLVVLAVFFTVLMVWQPWSAGSMAPVVQQTGEPQPLRTTSEPAPSTTQEPLETSRGTTPEPVETTGPTTEQTGAYRTGKAVGEELNRLWESTKDFGQGVWAAFND